MFQISVFFSGLDLSCFPGFFKTGKLETLLHTQHYGMSAFCCELVLLLLTITYFI